MRFFCHIFLRFVAAHFLQMCIRDRPGGWGFNPETVMLLVNALVFEAEWQDIYPENKISDGIFTNRDGQKRTVKMIRWYLHGNSMASSELEVTLNRPFFYAIIDNSTNMPIFLGTVMAVSYTHLCQQTLKIVVNKRNRYVGTFQHAKE